MLCTRQVVILVACLVAGSCMAAAVTFRRELDPAYDIFTTSQPDRRVRTVLLSVPVAFATLQVELIGCAIHQDARKGAILLCTDNLLSGNCNFRVRKFGECQTLAGDNALDNAISSGRADECSLCAGKS